MKKYQTVTNMSNEKLLGAYKELKLEKLPKNGIVRSLQVELYHELGKTVKLISVQNYVAMEMLDRFYEGNN